MLALLLCAVAALVGAQEEPWSPKIHSVEGRRLSAPEHQESLAKHGVWLKAVHAHRLGDDGIVHVRHEVEEPLVAGRRLAYAGTNQRDLVKLMWKLSMVCYGPFHKFPEEVFQPIFEAGDSLFGPSIKTYEAELEAQEAAFDARIFELAGIGSYSSADGDFGFDTTPKDSIGVHALEFQAPGLGTVLAFRGTYSYGDFDNVKPWISRWVLARMDREMKHQWTTDANLPWTDQMVSNSNDAIADALARTMFTVGSLWYSSSFLAKLAVKGATKGLDTHKVAKTGYWEFTKAIARSVKSNLKLGAGEQFYLTGHSQGGTRAALVSLLYEKTSGGADKHKAITFGAVGGSCFVRELMYTCGNFLDDVDPYIHHDQVTDYAHVLDIYGNFDRDVGNVCVYGKTGLENSRARKYCEVIQGQSGPKLMVAGIANFWTDLQNQFRRCRYYTHGMYAINFDVENPDFLNEVGETDYGCRAAEVIPQGDPNKRCPVDTSRSPW